uniref:Uncharacterized protein MANES_14G081000 n=1 Tax=Rhizophora mucronata TaxID=61149 RepID=A0A2P2JSV4_RHIMU
MEKAGLPVWWNEGQKVSPWKTQTLCQNAYIPCFWKILPRITIRFIAAMQLSLTNILQNTKPTNLKFILENSKTCKAHNSTY